MAGAVVPTKYLQSLRPYQQGPFNTICEMLSRNETRIALTGEPGTGKSHLVTELIKHLFKNSDYNVVVIIRQLPVFTKECEAIADDNTVVLHLTYEKLRDDTFYLELSDLLVSDKKLVISMSTHIFQDNGRFNFFILRVLMPLLMRRKVCVVFDDVNTCNTAENVALTNQSENFRNLFDCKELAIILGCASVIRAQPGMDEEVNLGRFALMPVGTPLNKVLETVMTRMNVHIDKGDNAGQGRRFCFQFPGFDSVPPPWGVDSTLSNTYWWELLLLAIKTIVLDESMWVFTNLLKDVKNIKQFLEQMGIPVLDMSGNLDPDQRRLALHDPENEGCSAVGTPASMGTGVTPPVRVTSGLGAPGSGIFRRSQALGRMGRHDIRKNDIYLLPSEETEDPIQRVDEFFTKNDIPPELGVRALGVNPDDLRVVTRMPLAAPEDILDDLFGAAFGKAPQFLCQVKINASKTPHQIEKINGLTYEQASAKGREFLGRVLIQVMQGTGMPAGLPPAEVEAPPAATAGESPSAKRPRRGRK